MRNFANETHDSLSIYMVSRPAPSLDAAAAPRRAFARGESSSRGTAWSPPPAVPFHVLLYVLSVDDAAHSTYRCYQRTIFTEAFGMAFGGRMRVDAFRSVALSYVIDGTATATQQLQLEARTHGDVLLLPHAQTCLGKVFAALRQLRDSRVAYDAVLFSDDDAFIHPHRLALDLAEVRRTRALKPPRATLSVRASRTVLVGVAPRIRHAELGRRLGRGAAWRALLRATTHHR